MHQHYQFHDEKPLKADPQLLRRMLRYARPYRGILTLALFLTMLVTALQLAQPYILKIAIDQYILGPGDAAGLRLLAFSFFLAFSLGLLLHYWQFNLLMRTGQRIVNDIRRDAFAHLQELPVSFLDRNPAGRLVTRVTNDAEVISEMYTGFLLDLCRDLLLLTGIVVVMLRLHAPLALLTFTFIPLVVLAMIIYRRKARPVFREMRRQLARLNAFAAENIAGIRIIQAFLQQERRLGLFSAINEEHYRAALREMKIFAVFRPAMDLIRSLALATLLWFGGASVLAGVIPFGVLFAFINYLEQFFRPLNDLSERYSIFQSALAAAERIFQMLDEKKEAETATAAIGEKVTGERPTGEGTTKIIRGDIDFNGVWFTYTEEEDEEWVLRDINLQIRAGEKVAIAGPTGAGKTSLVHLLNRFYPVARGKILIDGIDIGEFGLKELRRQVGIVPQDIFLFNASIRENITLNAVTLSETELEAVCRAAGLYPFIQEMPQKFETPVGERGFSLSTGQRQLLAMARILVFNPSIFILDEATAHLDAETEELLQQSLAHAIHGRTSIMIAHRLSTLRLADRIFFLQQGILTPVPSFEHLLQKLGILSAEDPFPFH